MAAPSPTLSSDPARSSPLRALTRFEPVDEWRSRAACRDADAGWFFDTDEPLRARARALCASCPVRGECLEDALAAREDYGIWGGLDERERQRILRRRRRAA